MGVCRPVLQILTLFQTKKYHFPHPFSDLEVVTKRNITCLHKTEIMSSLERLKRQQKYFLKSISNSHITLSFPSFRIETTNILIHNRSSFVNHTRFQTKLGKIYTRSLSDQNGAKTLPFRVAHTDMALIFTGVPPPPPPPHLTD